MKKIIERASIIRQRKREAADISLVKFIDPKDSLYTLVLADYDDDVGDDVKCIFEKVVI